MVPGSGLTDADSGLLAAIGCVAAALLLYAMCALVWGPGGDEEDSLGAVERPAAGAVRTASCGLARGQFAPGGLGSAPTS